MTSATYTAKRAQLKTYFDRTAADAWAKLTSDAPVSGIRATVRAGRDAMRQTVLDWLPIDMTGMTLLDAGCGPGQFSLEAARRGADVTAVDLSPTLLDLARERAASERLAGSVRFIAGDMFDPSLGRFDYVTAMDSLIHYPARDIVGVLQSFAARADAAIIFTFAPRTPALSLMHAVGSVFPKGDRAPAIQPVGEQRLKKLISGEQALDGFAAMQTKRVQSGFYTSQALELKRSEKGA